MITAMPDVKPTITGFGMNRMTLPSRATPIASSITPAISVATCRPAMPYCAVMPASTTMKAPVGPEICTRVPPRSEVDEPGDDRRVEALLGLGAGGDRERHRERQRDDADDDAGDDVPPDFAPAEQARLAGFQECDHGEGGNDTPMTHFGDAPVILDGGLATELEARGCDISGALWSARVLRERPDAVEQLHYDYYAAGAGVAITASYQASYEGFASIGIGADETTRLLRLSVELARSARDRFRRDHPEDSRELLVAASVGPYGAISHDGAEYRGDYRLTVDALVEFHARRFEVLATAGADLLACETIPALDEARAYVELLARNLDVRAWLSFTSPDGEHASHGEPLVECARLADRIANVVAVGVNCVKPEVVARAIGAMKAGTSKQIVVYPNSGERWDAGDESWHGMPGREGLAALAPEWIRAGAAIVGGCCRVGPGQIASLSRTLTRAARANPG